MPGLQVPHSPFALPAPHERGNRHLPGPPAIIPQKGALRDPDAGTGKAARNSAAIQDELSKELARERAARRSVE